MTTTRTISRSSSSLPRRTFLQAAAVAVGTGGTAWAQTPTKPTRPGGNVGKVGKKHSFKLKYAPNFGQFENHAGKDPIDQLKFMADQGFTAVEDNGMRNRPVELQDKIGREVERLGMTMGIFVVNFDTGFKTSLASGDEALRDQFLAAVRDSVEVAKRVNAKWVTTLTGNIEPRLRMGYQEANVIDAVRRAADICAPSGLVMVFEPLNFRDHPNFFLTSNHQAYALMKAVNHPSAKILFDLYHTQINEGELINNFNKCFDEIGYIQTGDTPGRKEPGTGEVNYRNVFKHIYEKGYRGVLGMEHGKSMKDKEGELALIASYVDADNFPVGGAPGAPAKKRT